MATDDEKKLHRSEASKKAAATRKANREAEEARNKDNSHSKWLSWLPWVLFVIALFIALLLWHPWTISFPNSAPALGTGNIDPVTTATSMPPVPVSCKTPSIQASLDGSSFKEWGEYLDTSLGRRTTFTNRKVVVPAKAWNESLTSAELKIVETTWLYMQVCVPEGMTGRVFAGGFEQSTNRYENGILMTLQPGVYEFRLRNGEIVLWYPQQDKFTVKDLTRIIEQIRNGNFDIKSPLAFFGVTTDLLSKIPDDLVKERNVQVVPAPDPTLAQ